MTYIGPWFAAVGQMQGDVPAVIYSGNLLVEVDGRRALALVTLARVNRRRA